MKRDEVVAYAKSWANSTRHPQVIWRTASGNWLSCQKGQFDGTSVGQVFEVETIHPEVTT